ncbi:efflux RND transporter permease subunit [Paraburkholderia sp. C35]|uniref:efflux RND transporter permease subunit n=1 Tax=Paraburkholderia sp. C35 TaxID=2126993 RepID=UPI000D69FD3B|nr:efflux RND transporter permease subunit [Paraburkholderia sp. C35]
MNISALFIRRPVATTLLAFAILISGVLAYFRLPVAPLPNIAFPVIVVQANMAGASPEIMASTVAEPLERRLGTIADVEELTSISYVGSSQIVIEFGLKRDINGAARDVEAAIQAARADLPTTLRSNPTYRQFNPADAPIMVLALTSDTLTKAQLYDSADSVIQQQLSQINGVGQITVGGGALPSVRVELQPGKLNSYGIGLEDVRASISAANADSAKGHLDTGDQRYVVTSNDQITHAAPYRDLVVAYRNGSPVHLRDVAEVRDSNENIRNAGLFNGQSAILVIVYPMPGSNVVNTVQQIRSVLPSIEATLPSSVHVNVAIDRSESVRSSVGDTERTLFIAVLLVVGVVFIFLQSPRAVLVPAVALPLSIIGTFGPMYLLGYSIDNLSLMALTIGTGFVVDDAVVVLENIVRHMELGLSPKEAALKGSGEVGFTVISMSISLIAVFLPIMLMPGVVGLLFHEFAVTLSIAILISLVISLTVTPAMCAYALSRENAGHANWRWAAWIERQFERFKSMYSRSLAAVLDHSLLVILLLFALLVGNVFLFKLVPTTFFPEQDTGILIGQIIADQSISFTAMQKKLAQLQAIVQKDPAVLSVAGFTGGRALNTANVFIELKPLAQRHATATQVVNRLRPKLNAVSGARLFIQAQQDLRIGGRQSAAEYQYTLTSDDSAALFKWTPLLVAALAKQHGRLLDVNSDLQQNGLQTYLTISRSTAARYGFQPNQIDNVLYDAFGQRTVSTIYNPLNQYFVVMEVAPEYWQYPQTLNQIYLSTAAGNATGTDQTQMPGATVSGVTPFTAQSTSTSSASSSTNALNSNAQANATTNSIANSKGGSSTGSADSTSAETMVPLGALATWTNSHTATQVNHQSGLVAATISFNLPAGGSLSEAADAISETSREIGMPATVHGSFAGAAAAYSQSMGTVPLLVLAALFVVYIVLGVLYESSIHPLTILSTLPSAGIGATLALLIFGTPFSVIAMIGIILLIGIVKKNGIMMVDVAIQLQRQENKSARDAIHDAAVIRLRPIMMTTFAAVLGAVPLAIGIGQGASLRQPLGITVMGGLILSQMFTLYTTPVIYLYLDRLRARLVRWAANLPWNRDGGGAAPPAPTGQSETKA